MAQKIDVEFWADMSVLRSTEFQKIFYGMMTDNSLSSVQQVKTKLLSIE